MTVQLAIINATAPFLVMGFSLLNGMEFFAAPKNGIPFSI